jgi:hypothetical protein
VLHSPTTAGYDSRKALLLWKALYQDGRWVRSIAAAAEAAEAASPAAAAAQAAVAGGSKALSGLQLSSAFKSAIQERASLDGGLTLQSVTTARDGTHK